MIVSVLIPFTISIIASSSRFFQQRLCILSVIGTVIIKAFQRVRENNMDMTYWLEYFVQGLSTQMQEIRSSGEQTIHLDVLKQQHKLSARQEVIMCSLIDNESVSIKDLENIFPDVNRRTLQPEPKTEMDEVIIVSEGASYIFIYKPKSTLAPTVRHQVVRKDVVATQMRMPKQPTPSYDVRGRAFLCQIWVGFWMI